MRVAQDVLQRHRARNPKRVVVKHREDCQKGENQAARSVPPRLRIHFESATRPTQKLTNFPTNSTRLSQKHTDCPILVDPDLSERNAVCRTAAQATLLC